MRGAIITIAVMLGLAIVGPFPTRLHGGRKLVIALLVGLGVLALVWLRFLVQLEGMGGD